MRNYKNNPNYELILKLPPPALHSISPKNKKNPFAITRITKGLILNGGAHLESNQGHMDFQSIALPTELWHRVAFAG